MQDYFEQLKSSIHHKIYPQTECKWPNATKL